MINKQNLWFLTLFSLILVLSVYYITMPSELLLTNNSNYESDANETSKENDEVVVTNGELLVAMRISLDEERTKTRETLQEVLTSSEASSEDKNKAYEELKMLNDIKAKEEMIEAKIKQKQNLDNFVRIEGNQIQVVVISKEHNNKLANEIMRTIQEEFPEKVYITVKFEE